MSNVFKIEGSLKRKDKVKTQMKLSLQLGNQIVVDKRCLWSMDWMCNSSKKMLALMIYLTQNWSLNLTVDIQEGSEMANQYLLLGVVLLQAPMDVVAKGIHLVSCQI